MSKQILRSGTSIGANIAESICAESPDDFIHKLAIAQKEASETRYWLKLLYRSDFITEKQFNSIDLDCRELLNIISAIIVEMKNSQK